MPLSIRIQRGVAVAVVAAALAAGCQSGSGSNPPTLEQLSQALLTNTDMGSDWNETQRQVFTNRGNENPSIDPSLWCPDAGQIAEDLVTLAGSAGADVEMDNGSIQVGSRLLRQQAWNDDNARTYMATVKDAIVACDGRTWTDESGAEWTIEAIPDPGVGDEAAGFLSTIAPPTGSEGKMASTGRLMVVRVADTIMILQIGDVALVDSPDLLSDYEWTDFLQIAVDKIDDL